ncbi:hexokinase [Trypanosoma rangeli SC58]|uniref:Phosphotransferase n=1 Tax=Trypanosoma rangeli SC58 TaxID=429131 RepID=A0A061ITW3_TRYRA|nr:hexokinase [Trypanosoma rangeli SC58]ESL08543.1 hexokinase [Trypanosoma rangeli SC58]ESL10405.1 hexokinase [Trypanosoma rangeli SC58]
MATRLNNLLQHIAVKDNDSDTMRHVKQRMAMASLASQFTVSKDHLKQLTMYMIHEMIEGLEGRESTLRMLPSYVFKANPSKATGAFYALDLGGTNFRVLRVSCKDGRVVSRTDSKFVIPQQALQGDAADLFDFVASSVKKTMQDKAPEDLNRTVPLGFTFSFPTEQKSINQGVLLKWTKGFSTKGVEGKDVVELLQASLRRVHVKVDVVALCNDTVGTLIARYFVDPDAQVGVIIGTGSNACYFEDASAVKKDPTVAARGTTQTVINMECGNFDSKYKYVLPTCAYDEAMDAITLNHGYQAQEKMVSGMYLGEVARRMIVHLAELRCLSPSLASAMSKPWSFETKFMGMLSADRMPGLQFTRSVIRKLFKVDVPSVEDLHVIRDVCRLVRGRAAQISAMFCSAPLAKTHKQGCATVAVDGSVYEKTPSFRRLLRENMNTILGAECNVKVALVKDGSGIGAAFISALAVNDK